MTTQIVVNHQAVTNLAAKLERLGYSGDDVHEVAEHIAMNLLADGYRPVERIQRGLRPTKSGGRRWHPSTGRSTPHGGTRRRQGDDVRRWQ